MNRISFEITMPVDFLPDGFPKGVDRPIVGGTMIPQKTGAGGSADSAVILAPPPANIIETDLQSGGNDNFFIHFKYFTGPIMPPGVSFIWWEKESRSA